MKIYLAGPMTGIKDFNFPAFFMAAHRLEQEGHVVYNPAEEDCKHYGGVPSERVLTPHELRVIIQHDLLLILWRVEAVVCLEGWESSKGSLVEVALARFLHIPVYEYDPSCEGCLKLLETVKSHNFEE